MSLEIVDEATWEDRFSKNHQSIFYSPIFLKKLQKAFDYDLHYYLKEQNGTVVFAAAIFSKGKDVVVPIAFTYSSIYFERGLSDRKRNDCFNEFIVLLKKRHSKISLRLGLDVYDLRPFTWQGFQVSDRYTYIRNKGVALHQSVQKKIEIALQKDFEFRIDQLDELQAQKYVEGAVQYGLPQKQLHSYVYFFKSLVDDGTLVQLICLKQGEMICSRIVLADRKKKMLFTLLTDGGEDESARMFLHHETFNWSDAEGFEQIDLCGANEKGIAEFKSYFNPELKKYHLVNFNPTSYRIKSLLSSSKKAFKKILGNGK